MASKFNSSSLRAFVGTRFPLLILRVLAAGFLFYYHGYGKLAHIFGDDFPPDFDPVGLGTIVSFSLSAFAEGICTIFVIIGFYTRLAALILIVNFAVAYYAASKELALLYLLCFVVIFLIGPGKLSFDSRSRR